MKNNLLQKIQKILCYAFLIASAGVLICSFIYIPRGWTQFQIEGNDYLTAQSFYKDLRTFGRMATGKSLQNWSVVFGTQDEAKLFYFNFWGEIQSVNNWLFALGLSGIVLTAIIGIFGNFGRNKYYISNLVAGVSCGSIGVITSIIVIIKSFILKSDFAMIMPDIQKYYEYSSNPNVSNKYYEITSSNCWISIIVPIIYIIFCVGLITFTVIKYKQSSKKEAAINE